jgi:hypothetical protein
MPLQYDSCEALPDTKMKGALGRGKIRAILLSLSDSLEEKSASFFESIK